MQLVIGRVSHAHGVRGEVAVEVSTDEPDIRFAAGTTVTTEPPTRGPLTVLSSRWHSGRLLVRFGSVTDRSTAEWLRGTLLMVDAQQVPPSEDSEEWHDHELVDLAVVDTHGRAVGMVTDVLHLPEQELLVVRTPAEVEALIPFVAAIVTTVEVARGRLVVDPPSGLIESGDQE